MTLNKRTLIGLAVLGSAGLLIGAFVFQAIGYAPCKMCLWQRWPHAVAIVVGALWTFLPITLFIWLGAAAALTSSAIGGYHTGVERGWWEGPSSCSGGGGLDLGSLSGSELLSTEIAETVVMCDDVAWAFAGLSMASWNMLFSLGLAVIWATASFRRP
jgi:protein dithiol:quinone oxidoreductase